MWPGLLEGEYMDAVREWDKEAREAGGLLLEIPQVERASGLCATTDGKCAIVAQGGKISVLDILADGACRHSFEPFAELHTGGLEMENLILLPGGKRLVVSWWVGGTQGWAVVLLESGEVLHRVESDRRISSLLATPDGKHLLTFASGTIKLWELERPAEALQTVEMNQDEQSGRRQHFGGMAINNAGTVVASGLGKMVWLWDREGGNMSRRYTKGGDELQLEHCANVSSICFDANGAFLYANCGKDDQGSIGVWRVEDGTHRRGVSRQLLRRQHFDRACHWPDRHSAGRLLHQPRRGGRHRQLEQPRRQWQRGAVAAACLVPHADHRPIREGVPHLLWRAPREALRCLIGLHA